MASSRRSSNGRSPLVNQQSQITSFFSKATSPSPSPLVPKKVPIKSNPNPNTKPKLKSSPSTSPCASPTTPLPLQVKRKITAPISAIVDLKPSYGQEIVGKRVKVYWPLDRTWYEGCVKSFDGVSGEHLVKYDDGDEEMIDLAEEKIELVVEAPARKLRRLRKSLVVEEAEEEEEKLEDLESVEDDSEDEDWGKIADKQVYEDEDVDEDMDLVVEEEKDDAVGSRSRKAGADKVVVSRKRKSGEGVKLSSSSSKKSKTLADKKSANSKVDNAVNGVNGKELVKTNEDCK